MPESRKHYCQLARNLDDEKLLELDAHYRQNSRTSVDWELHGIVRGEIQRRSEFRQRQLERSLWLSSRRGRFVESMKRWLIRQGLWSSAVADHKRPHIVVGRLVVLFGRFHRNSRRLAIHTLPGRQRPLEQL